MKNRSKTLKHARVPFQDEEKDPNIQDLDLEELERKKLELLKSLQMVEGDEGAASGDAPRRPAVLGPSEDASVVSLRVLVAVTSGV